MDDIKKLHEQKERETKELLKKSTLGTFLYQAHVEVFTNLDQCVLDMATNPLKRYLMLTAEYDGIELLTKLTRAEIYLESDFKKFINEINDYFDKIQSHEKYEQVEEYKENEEKTYKKFKEIKSNLT